MKTAAQLLKLKVMQAQQVHNSLPMNLQVLLLSL
jgi:hypothetical protein